MANATKYVNNVTGSNANTGNSEAQAYATIAFAISAIAGANNIIYVKNAGTNYTLTAALALTTLTGDGTGRNIIEGYTTTPGARDGRPVITSATNSVNLFELNNCTLLALNHLNMTHTAGTRGAAIATVTASSTDVRVDDCIMNGCSYAISASSREIFDLAFTRNYVTACTSGGVLNSGGSSTGTQMRPYAFGNTFLSNTGNAWDNANANAGGVLIRNIFASNGYGVYDTGTTRTTTWVLLGNSFYGQTNDGFRSDETTGSNALAVANNIFYGNGGYGINLQDTAAENNARQFLNMNNAYGSNTSGARNNFAAGLNDVTLTGNPFTNAGSGDFSLNSTAGAGAACRAAGFPGTMPGGSTVGYVDIGVAQHQDTPSSSGQAVQIFGG